jgi:hypothetical protein
MITATTLRSRAKAVRPRCWADLAAWPVHASHVWAGAEVLELSLSRLLSASRFPDPHVQEPGQYQAKRFSLRLAALVKVSATTGQPGRQGIAAQQRHHLSAGRVGLRSRFASDVAMETPTGRCSGRGDDTSSRPRSRSERRPCPRRNAPRRRTADTAPEPTEPSATPCHILTSGVPLLLTMDLDRILGVLLPCQLPSRGWKPSATWHRPHVLWGAAAAR